MSEIIEIVIPMAGLGQRFSAAGFTMPKPLIDVLGKPMIQWVVENLKPKSRASHFTFICNQQHLVDYQLETFLSSIAPGANVIPVPKVTEGAACTVLLAQTSFGKDRPVLIANSDQWIESDIDQFLDAADKERSDGFIMTFPANETKWSYAKVNADGFVTAVAEKDPISEHATVGIYYFRRGSDLVRCAESMIEKNIRTNGEFYVCPIYNELIAERKRVRLFEIRREAMHGLGTPEDLARFLASEQISISI